MLLCPCIDCRVNLCAPYWAPKNKEMRVGVKNGHGLSH